MKINKARLKQIENDLFGGLTAGVVALPLALAFGVQSGLGAIAGLYGAIFLGFIAAILGGTPTQVSGPTGPMTVVSGLIIATAIQTFGGIDNALPFILTTFLLAGSLQVVFGVVRFGDYIRYIPYPVISGFMSGIGTIIILLQLFPALGHHVPVRVIDVFLTIQQPLQAINWQATALCITTIAIIYILPFFNRTFPSNIVALIAVSIACAYYKLDVPLIGDIPAGLPSLKFDILQRFDWINFKLILIPGFTLAALGAIDSLLTSIVADNITKTKHHSNRELIGQGIGNMVVACVGGIPGAGATMRTVVNVTSGGRTRLSGVIHSLFLLSLLLGASKYAAQIPLSVLAGILITVGISIIDYRGFKHLFQIPKTDAIIMITVLLLTVFIDLLTAVAVGMVLASIFFMKKMGDIAKEKTIMTSLKKFKDDMTCEAEANFPEEFLHQVYVKQLYGPLFFGVASHFQELIQSIPAVKAVILRMGRVPYIDQSGLYALEEAILYLESKGVHVALCEVQSQPKDMLKRINLIPDLIQEEHVFADFETCEKWLTDSFKNKTGLFK